MRFIHFWRKKAIFYDSQRPVSSHQYVPGFIIWFDSHIVGIAWINKKGITYKSTAFLFKNKVIYRRLKDDTRLRWSSYCLSNRHFARTMWSVTHCCITNTTYTGSATKRFLPLLCQSPPDMQQHLPDMSSENTDLW